MNCRQMLVEEVQLGWILALHRWFKLGFIWLGKNLNYGPVYSEQLGAQYISVSRNTLDYL